MLKLCASSFIDGSVTVLKGYLVHEWLVEEGVFHGEGYVRFLEAGFPLQATSVLLDLDLPPGVIREP